MIDRTWMCLTFHLSLSLYLSISLSLYLSLSLFPLSTHQGQHNNLHLHSAKLSFPLDTKLATLLLLLHYATMVSQTWAST